MKIRNLFLSILLLFLTVLFVPSNAKALDLKDTLTSENSFILKIQEGVEYFFAFKVEKKIGVLENYAEKRLTMAEKYADLGNNERVQNLVQNYLVIKEKQNNLLGKIDNGEVLGMIEERTVEQQITMEQIKTRIDEGTKKEVIKVQEQVVNQVAKHVIDVNGPEGATEFMNEVVHVWAPGTGPGGGDVGIVYEGGAKLIYAPGTGPGGTGGVVIEGGELKFATGTSMDGPGADIKNVEVKTGGSSESGGTNVDSGGQNMAPGTTSGGNTIDPGGVDPGTSSDGETWIAP